MSANKNTRLTRLARGASPAAGTERDLANRLLLEIGSDTGDAEIALRGNSRWVRRFDPVRLAAVRRLAEWLPERPAMAQ